MAKISSLEIEVTAKSDRSVSVNKTFEMKVMSDGIFWAILPREDVDVIRGFGDLKRYMNQDRSRKWCITGISVKEIRDRLRPWVESLLEVEVETRTLILFRFESDCPHSKDKLGNIYRNGSENPDYDGRTGYPCGWEGTIKGSSSFRGDEKSFYVRILSGIWVETKTTAKGQEPSYQYSKPELKELGPEGQRLSSWSAHLSTGCFRGEKTSVDYVEYTEDRAKFFDTVQLTMCDLQTRMNVFFTSEGIEARIAQGNFLALGSAT